ncbi:D-alanyl-D-alanine carboxypeptidase [Streptomyces sp. NPDC058252]|uniref:D-alanyl-D-alanine carboxypeptidase n=1 Tax=Streptomyces sp. NPDC058252 TaxID=3346405 RepID=UPI0036E23087
MEEASVAGESPDRSKQHESSASSAEPTPGAPASVPSPTRGAASSSTPAPADPRLAVARERAATVRVDQATAVFSTKALAATEPGESAEPGEKSAEGDSRLRAAVAAWVAGADGEESPADGGAGRDDRDSDAGRFETSDVPADAAEPAGDAESGADGEGGAAAAGSKADAESESDADADSDADAESDANADADSDAGGDREPEASDEASAPGTDSVEERDSADSASDEAAVTGESEGEADSASPAGSAAGADSASATGGTSDADESEGGADSASPAGSAADADSASAIGGTFGKSEGGADSAPPAGSAADADSVSAIGGTSDAGESEGGADSTSAAGSAADADAGSVSDDGPKSRSAGDSSDKGKGTPPGPKGTAEAPSKQPPAASPESVPTDSKASADAKGTTTPEPPVDQPTAIFKAPRPPAVDQPTTMLKLGGAPKPTTEPTTERPPAKPEAGPAEKPSGTAGAKPAGAKPAAGKPSGTAGAKPAAGKPSGTAGAKPAGPSWAKPGDRPSGTAGAKPEAEAERTSKFVALKSLDEAAAPAKPKGAPAPGTANRPEPAAATAALPQVGPERTTQQPLPPKPPLDLLAELTNTPPPPQTPVRTIVRRVKIWTPLVLLLVVIFAVVQAVRPLPTPGLTLTADETYTFEGGRLDLPWPGQGQSAIEVEGVGTLGTDGKQAPAPIASVAKIMTAYVILQKHPLKGNEGGPQITVDQQAEDESKLPDESTAAMSKGQKFTERQMLQMLMIPSGNNAARLLARWDSDNETFVGKMNAAAKELGMTQSTYTDPSGLDKTTVSTATDQLKLAKAVMQNPVFRSIVAMASAKIPGLDKPIYNNNDLLVKQVGVIGLKTGSSTPAGGNLVWAATKTVDGKTQTVYGAVLGQNAGTGKVWDSLQLALTNSQKLIDKVQQSLTSAMVVKKGDVVGYVDDQLGGRTPVVATKNMKAVGWPGLKTKLSIGTESGKTVPHTGTAGTVVGELTVGDGSSHAVTIPVALRSDLAEPGLGAKLTRVS